MIVVTIVAFVEKCEKLDYMSVLLTTLALLYQPLIYRLEFSPLLAVIF